MTTKSTVIILSATLLAFGLCQPAAQGGASLQELLGKANGNAKSDGDLAQTISDVFGQAGGTTTNQGGDSNLNDTITDLFGKPADNANKGGDVGANPTTNDRGGAVTGTGTCTCVPYYLCNNGSINTNGEGLIDIRVNDDEGPCGTVLEMCCDKVDQRDTPILPTPPPVKRIGCGYRNPDGTGFRITGDKDNEAQFGEFPWMVAILREETIEGNGDKLNVYQCGGALVHPQVVVTAAHCVKGKDKKYKIRAGEWDTQHTQELYPHQDRDVQTVIIHPEYYAGALYNDVAVLYLNSPLDLADNVQPVCLPPENTVVDSATCFATGWGKDVFGQKGKYQVILKKIDLPMVPRAKCQMQLRTTRLGTNFVLHRSFVCAGGIPGKDTCKGDGGSPLVCPIPGQKNRFYQIGIVAWGIGCGQDNYPGVYVNVPLFRQWIDAQIKSFGLESSYYEF